MWLTFQSLQLSLSHFQHTYTQFSQLHDISPCFAAQGFCGLVRLFIIVKVFGHTIDFFHNVGADHDLASICACRYSS